MNITFTLSEPVVYGVLIWMLVETINIWLGWYLYWLKYKIKKMEGKQ